MYKDKTFIGIIPARSGSKGIPHKNIHPFAGKPLMAWSILAALESGVLDEVFVSTDSEQYAGIARQYGASVPFLRPVELSGDAVPASGVIVHAIKSYREQLRRSFDYFILLQPTTPFRKPAHIQKAIEMAVDENLTSIVSFSRFDYDLRMIGTLPDDMRLSSFNPSNSPNDTQRQSAETIYWINGMIYLSLCGAYEQTKNFYGPNGKAMVVNGRYPIDIDDETDFIVSEFLTLTE